MTGVEEAAAIAALSGAATGGTAATATGLTAAEIAAAMMAANEVTAAGGSIMATGAAAAPTIAEVGAGGLLGSAGATGADIAGSTVGSVGGSTGTSATPFVSQGTSSAFGPMPGVNEFGYQGLSSVSSNPANTQFMTGSANELANLGASGQSLASTTADAMTLPPISSSGLSTNDYFRLAQQGYKMANGQDKQQQPGRAPIIPGSPEDMAQRRRNGFGELSPYQNLQGFNPRRYGANQQRGLLGG